MRKKIRFYKNVLAEILEVLCTICLALSMDREHGKYRDVFRDHYEVMKRMSGILRYEEEKPNDDEIWKKIY